MTPSMQKLLKTLLKRIYFSINHNANNYSIINILTTISQDHSLLNGPLKNLRYPSLQSFGSSLAPKLIGSYESELQKIIEVICRSNYSCVVDIGCAEGYYAVGLALRNQKALVYAFDIDPIAKELCQAMALHNQVADRVAVSGLFNLDELSKLPCLDHNGLIISDCEGAEVEIFNKQSKNWKLLINNYDLLVEIHEFFRPGAYHFIKDQFSDSHRIQTISSIPDYLRPFVYGRLIPGNYPYHIKYNLLAEGRQTRMQWLFMTRK